MLLTVDIGNSNIAVAVFEKENMVTSFRLTTDRNRTLDEYAVLLVDLVENNNINLNDISGAIISCVVPQLLDVVSQAIGVYMDLEPLVLNYDTRTNLDIICDNPREVGADRIANAVAAYEIYNKATIVVDFGTATTFDCITDNGEYMGGVISPGIIISADALFSHASQLSPVEFIKPRNVIGRTTIESLQSGIIYGYTSMVDGMIEKIMYEMNTETNVIATGGLSHIVSRESRYIEDVDDFLTLKGLRTIFDLNV